MTDIGAKLKLVRTAMGASKPKYANRLGVSVRSLARWEKDQTEVPDGVVTMMYEDLDLMHDVIYRQNQMSNLEVKADLEGIPADLVRRGVDEVVWNQCLAYCLLDQDLKDQDDVRVRWG